MPDFAHPLADPTSGQTIFPGGKARDKLLTARSGIGRNSRQGVSGGAHGNEYESHDAGKDDHAYGRRHNESRFRDRSGDRRKGPLRSLIGAALEKGQGSQQSQQVQQSPPPYEYQQSQQVYQGQQSQLSQQVGQGHQGQPAQKWEDPKYKRPLGKVKKLIRKVSHGFDSHLICRH